MYSTWYELNMTYYAGKISGFFPLVINLKCITFWYSLVILIVKLFVGIIVNIDINLQIIPSEEQVLMNIIRIEVFIVFIIGLFNIALSTLRSKQFFEIPYSFSQFDEFILQMKCPPNYKTQIFYLLYVLCVGIYHFSLMLFLKQSRNDVTIKSIFKLFVWTMISLSSMINLTQYIICIRMLRNRYSLANLLFKNSIRGSQITRRYLYPNEIDNLFIELRHLMEKIKAHYANHTILIIVESVLLLVSGLTKLTINYTRNFEITFTYNLLFSIYNILKFIFLIFMVKEAHNTIEEANKTVLIAHEGLHIVSDTLVLKEYEIFILNFWNHPIVFNVHDIFYLDYKLLQSIIASSVTYVVFMVQIQLALFNRT